MYSTEGGMDIEEVAEKTPDKIFYEHIDPKVGLLPFQCRKIAFNLKLAGNAYKEMVKFVKCLYEAYLGSDSSLFEINPVLKTSDDKINSSTFIIKFPKACPHTPNVCFTYSKFFP